MELRVEEKNKSGPGLYDQTKIERSQERAVWGKENKNFGFGYMEFDELKVFIHLLVEIWGLACRILEAYPNRINETAVVST